MTELPKLTVLSVSCGVWKIISLLIPCAKNIQKLYITGGFESCVHVSDDTLFSLAQAKYFTSLIFQFPGIKEWDKLSLRYLKNLTYIEVFNNEFTRDSIEELAKAVSYCTSLRVFNITVDK